MFKGGGKMSRKITQKIYESELAVKNPTAKVVGKYIDMHTPISHYCTIHDVIWDIAPMNALRGSGCELCRRMKLHKQKKRTNKQYIEELSIVNPNIEPLEDYINANTLMLHRCKIDGHEWKTTPGNILSGHGCPKCQQRKLAELFSRTNEEYIDEVANINPDIEVIGAYINSNTPILHKCKIDGCEWLSRPSYILSGRGCPICHESSGERTVRQWLESNKIEYIFQYRFPECRDINPLPFDFYLPKYNTCIEYNGGQHFFPVDFSGKGPEHAKQQFGLIQHHDKIKEQYCKDNNIPLLKISYLQNIEEELNNFLFI